MELLLVILGVAGVWWWKRSKRQARAERYRRDYKLAVFEAPDRDLAVHFPSMTFFQWTLGAMGIAFAGPVRRDDGPRWYIGKRTGPKAAEDWEALAASTSSQLETAYQRYIHADLAVEVSSMVGDVWLEQMRGYVTDVLGAKRVFITGHDVSEPSGE
ncbi:MAG: hypothetical protein RLZZ450_6970 [Pseudomonadota bacterium]|jgi:hypothetical protein